MTTHIQPNFPTESRRNTIVFFCALATMAVSLSVITGFLFNIEALRSILPNFSEMKPNTAAAFLIAALGIASLATGNRTRLRLGIALICGILVSLIGAVTLVEYIAGSNIGADTILVPSSAISPTIVFPARMSPHTAFNLTLLGVSIAMLTGRQFFQKVSEVFAVLVSVTTFAALLGYLYQADQLYGISAYNSMALNTIALFFISSFGLLAANGNSKLVDLITSKSLGGSAARKLIPAVILIPTIVGWLRVISQDRGLYDTGFGAAMSIFFCVVLMCGLVLFFSGAVHKADSRRNMAEEELARKEERYRDLFDYSQGMICIHDLDGVLIAVNPATVRSLGYEHDEIIGRNLADFLPVEQRAGISSFLRQMANEGISNGLLPVVSKNGQQIVWRYHSILISEPDKEPYVIGHAQDVTELIEAQKQLKNLTLTDDLTGLYNRRGFMTMAEQQLKLEIHEKTARGLTLMFADIDGLKQINDHYGHEAGSEAIVNLSRVISSALRDADLVARWGGDEFVILTIGSHDDDAHAMSERINDKICEYNAQSGKPYQLACSIGVAPLPLDGNRSLEDILAEADKAMYAEKRRRKSIRESQADPTAIPHSDTNLFSARESPR